ncbi:MAG TPA: hypothetical protein VIB47_13325 [Dehalococcoidia bacterium]
MSLSRFRSAEPPRMAPVNIRACRFDRTLIRGGLAEGGILTCFESGRERLLHVSMTWDVLAELRAELARHGVRESDDVIVRCVLRYWGIEEFKRRLSEGVCLPEEGLLLDCLGGPCSSRPRRLLQACGLLPQDAA